MDRESANATRLRVNRIALIQQLDAQELVPKLVRARILTIQYDVPHINQGTSRIDRARRLVDCLLTPASNGDGSEPYKRPANWFLQFRSILLENSSVYGDLVTALDNTVIRIPEFAQRASDAYGDKTNHERSNQFRESINKDLIRTSEVQVDREQTKILPVKSNQEQITKIEFDRYTMNKIVIEGNFQKVISNLTYHSKIPECLFDELSSSSESYDQEQLQAEKQAFDDMRRLELMSNLIKKENSFANQNVFDTSVVTVILSDPSRHHHFYKYFIALSSIYGIHYDQEFVKTFTYSLDHSDLLNKLIDKGFSLYEFLYNYGRYELCRQIIEHIVQTLTKQVKHHNNQEEQVAIWSYLFRACCALIQAHNQGLEIKDAWARLEAANEISDNLKAISIGSDTFVQLMSYCQYVFCFASDIPNNDYAWLYYAASQTAFEDANFDACIQYSYRGLKSVDKNNHSLIVDLLCSLAQGLTSKWIMNKAQATSIMAVQYAAKFCGRNSPKYVYALQQLAQFSNEFIQDSSSVDLAQYVFDRARTVYGYESLAVAHAYRALSKSSITYASTSFSLILSQRNTTQNKNKDLQHSVYLHHAHEAYRIAQDWFGVDDRIRLFPFKMTLAHALQARVSADINENKEAYFNDAMELLDDCLSIAQDIFGSMSFKVAQVHRLRSATYLSKKMFTEAEQYLSTSLQIYKLCLPPNSFHYLVTKASLGLVYKQQKNYNQALPLFKSISESLDTNTQSFRWINMVLESLIECYNHLAKESTLDEESQTSPLKYTNEIEKVRNELNQWRRTSGKRIDLMEAISQEPTKTLHQFIHDSTKFQEATDRVHALIHTQQKVKNRFPTSFINTKAK